MSVRPSVDLSVGRFQLFFTYFLNATPIIAAAIIIVDVVVVIIVIVVVVIVVMVVIIISAAIVVNVKRFLIRVASEKESEGIRVDLRRNQYSATVLMSFASLS